MSPYTTDTAAAAAIPPRFRSYHGDLNETFVVGEVDEVSKQLIKVTHECLAQAIAACKPGVRYRDMGDIISKHAKGAG